MHKYLFIGGTHYSGTTIIHDCLRENPSISGFKNTKVPANEGQHLQKIIPSFQGFSRPSFFAYCKSICLNETSWFVNDDVRNKLLRQWGRWWNLDCDVLMEKTPANIVRTRWLQALFPNSHFVIMKRHPLAIAMGDHKGPVRKKFWSYNKYTRYIMIENSISHWLECYDVWEKDSPNIANSLTIQYEHFVEKPQLYCDAICKMLDIHPHNNKIVIKTNTNEKYKDAWKNLQPDIKQQISLKFKSTLEDLGYDWWE